VRGETSDSTSATIGDAVNEKLLEESGIEQGSELMELVHFSSIEDESASVRAKLQESSPIEGKGRYISQSWTDGTLCDLNHEPRTTEVQYHCAKTPPIDRISLIKEVTTCNYVIVVETPRLCSEPALAQSEDEIRQVHCRPILSDAELHERFVQNAKEAHASLLEGVKGEDEQGIPPLPESEETIQAEDVKPAKQTVQNKQNTGANIDAAATSLQEQLAKIMEKIAAISKERQGDGPLVQDIELVVGMDENGEVILDPHREGFGALSEKFLKATKAKGESSEEGEEDDPNHPKSPASDQWTKILDRVRELQGSAINSDGVVYQVRPDDALNVDQANDRSYTDHVETNTDTANQGQGPQAAKRPHSQPQRGNMMVREPETFAQRVDRIFKAEEERERRKAKVQSEDESADQEEAKLSKSRHDEL